MGEGYVLREVTAPEGFEVAEDVTFRVEDTTEIQTITMEDEKTPDQPEEPDTPDEPEEPDEPTPDIPQTGGSRVVIWVIRAADPRSAGIVYHCSSAAAHQ